MPSQISLNVGGVAYEGWESLRVERSLDSIAAPFQFTYIDAWTFRGGKWYISPQDLVEVKIDKDLVMTGYVDVVTSEVSQNSHSYSVSGRDKTADLVDCAVSINKNINIEGQTIDQLARNAIAPFGLELVNEANLNNKIDVQSKQPGQTAFQFIESVARKSGALFTTDEKGRLVITDVASRSSVTSLIEGKNIISARITLDFSGRYSDYYSYGQAKGSEFFFSTAAREIKALATDAGVKRFRPKVSLSGNSVNRANIIKGAEWEAAYSAARSTSIQIRVLGWRQGPSSSDPLWQVNAKTNVTAPSIGVNGDFLIERVIYSLDPASGEFTDLILTNEEAYIPNPAIPDDLNIKIEIPV